MIDTKNYFVKVNISYSVWEYILRISTISLFSIICFIIFGNDGDALSSFIWSTVAFLFITIFSTLVLLKNQRWVWFFVLAYLIKTIFGLLHYLYFIDPEYFQSGMYKPLTWEFEGVYDQIIVSAHDKIKHGILYYQFYEGGVNHQEIISLISIPFVYFGDYVLTINSINSFYSLLISINILLISKYQFNFDNSALKYVAITTAYFPISLIPSLLHRDIVGLALMSTGITLVLFSKRVITKYFMLIIACYLFYLHRTIYPVILLLAFTIDSVIFQNFRSKGKEIFYKVGIVIVGIILFPIIINYSNTEANESLAGGIFNFNILFIPLKLILGLIGPFPWLQFLLYEKIPAYAYQLQDYLQGTLNVALVAIIILFWKKYLIKDNFNLLNITGVLIIISGVFNAFMHMSYVAIGFVFLLPWLFTEIKISTLKKIYFYVFFALLFLNLVVFAFFGNLGIKSLI